MSSVSVDKRLDTEIRIPSSIEISRKQFQKMLFLTNAIEQGWTVKKSNDTFVFKKKHENRTEYLEEKYLETFLLSNLSTDVFSTDTS